jgi:ABC-2 type transport system ATP-binding protein
VLVTFSDAECELQVLLKVEGLVKDFGSLRALNGVSFSVPKGVVLGLLGPNGAGKTTCIDILLGTTIANAGRIEYFGQDFFSNKQACLRRINFASAYHSLQNRTSVRQNLTVFAHLYEVTQPQKRIDELIEYFEVADIADRRFGDLSAGQRTRVNLIKSLMNDPELILMDEPTASLDPDIADKTLSLIEELRRVRQLSILFTSHKMDEVSRICDEVIFLSKGEIVMQGTPLELTKRFSDTELRVTFEGERGSLTAYLETTGLVYSFRRDFELVVMAPESRIPKVLYDISSLGISITDLDIHKPDLDDVFLQIARNGDVP